MQLAFISPKTLSSLLNGVIEGNGAAFGLNKHYFISQGHFTNLPDSALVDVAAICEYVWEYRIKNILEEYVRGENQKEVDAFIEAASDAFVGQ